MTQADFDTLLEITMKLQTRVSQLQERVEALEATGKLEKKHQGGALSMIESRGPDGKTFVDPAKVRVVRDVQELYRRGNCGGHLKLAQILNAGGVASVTGARWHSRTVRVALGIELPPEEEP